MADMSTPSAYSSRYTRTISPPLSTAGASTISPQTQRLNVVTRLAIEGKAKRNESNVAIKMYLKLTLPADSITPGSAIPLFKEENVKILDHELHPLDSNSVPYQFSSAASPLLHNAARALNLPARSSTSYLTLFGQPPASSSRLSSTTHKDPDIPRLDKTYTGQILVSGYQVSFVLPKELPPRYKLNGIDSEGDELRRTTPTRSRRGSIGEKNVIMFMAGISMMVPYLSIPPRAPWLVSSCLPIQYIVFLTHSVKLSIPTPRCLQNNLKLRIFPANPATSSSTQSISSAEAESELTWDMAADPHVTRSTTSRRTSAYQYQHFADDESSDSASAPGFSDGVGIQGTFPSTERVRVRWAHPIRAVDDGVRDGRRRIGVTDARGEMVCTILGRGRERSGEMEGVLMRLEYKGSCKGVWFPGVATLLGMDVALEAKNAEVSWARGRDPKWTVVGGPGYTGHEIGGTHHPKVESENHISFATSTFMTSSDERDVGPSGPQTPSRPSSRTSSSLSLLRAPLPSQSAGEYSFETPSATPSEAGMSSLFSTTDGGGSRGRSRASSVDADVRDPSVPITLHLNINDLLPPNKQVFTFTVSGVVLVRPRTQIPSPTDINPHESSLSSDSDDNKREFTVSIPRFRVLASDNEQIGTSVRNGIDAGYETVDIYTSAEPKARKVELAHGSRSKVSAEGGRIVLRPTPRSSTSALPPIRGARRDDSDDMSRPPSRPRTPSEFRLGSSSMLRDTLLSSLKPRRDGPFMIPSVTATVTPLLSSGSVLPDAYAVRAVLPAPADADSEWLEFGLAQSSSPSTSQTMLKDGGQPPRVEIVTASLDGVPIRYETTVAAKPEQSAMSALAFEQMSGKEWITWVRLHVGALGGGMVEVLYIVKEKNLVDAKQKEPTRKGKEKLKEAPEIGVILPTFNIPVGWLQVDIESLSEFEITSVQSNLSHQQSLPRGRRLLHYSLESYFYCQLRLQVHPTIADTPWISPSVSRFFHLAACTAPIIMSLMLFLLLLGVNNDLGLIRRSLDSHSTGWGSGWDNVVSPTVTVTATAVSRSSEGQQPISSAANSSQAPHAQVTSITIIDVTSPPPEQPPEGDKRGGSRSPFRERFAVLDPRRIYIIIPNMREIAWNTLDTMVRGVKSAWYNVRRVYHFPLEPP
ncbi:hypothetical protein EW146_g1695 [Bondarzewia mesenterica]|uniref:Uncharacterized protein n=1 Tax=Bondarzewia mesenterica TaxID=1095465 RepID=A0A4S4M962_9AGAM|nr:hypothetical protein EW146_g1695 [Bondarzewia mesenterica]